MMSMADTTAMLSVMPRDLATSLMSLSFSSSWIGASKDCCTGSGSGCWAWSKARMTSRLNFRLMHMA